MYREAQPGQREAGYWGDYNCGVPEWTFIDTMMQIAEDHPVSS